jgi:hypothetical protein
MWLKCVMECFGQIIVPVRLFNIMVFMICTIGMWISQWAQWVVYPRKKPVHCTLVRGVTEGKISMGESLCIMEWAPHMNVTNPL